MKRVLFTSVLIITASCSQGDIPEKDGIKSKNRCSISRFSQGDYVDIPTGSYIKGESPLYPEETPTLQIQVEGFSLLAHEVTNNQFAAFVKSTGYITDAERSAQKGSPGAGSAVFTMPNKGNNSVGRWELVSGASWKTPLGAGSTIEGKGKYPVVHISHGDAMAYASWAGGRLPTEIEWEYAATLGLANPNNPKSNAYDVSGSPHANTWQGIFPVIDQASDGFSGSSPVGCFGPDRIGLHDMIGNVWEWTDTPYGSQTHTIKGGSYLCSDNFCVRYRPAARQPQETNFSSNHIGFRIIKTDTP